MDLYCGKEWNDRSRASNSWQEVNKGGSKNRTGCNKEWEAAVGDL